MSNKLDVIAAVGEYTNAQGQTKKRFVKVGSAWDKGQQGFSIKLDTIPAGNDWDGWLTARVPLERQDKPRQAQQAPMDDDSIPF
jgi:hypothetical protein